MSKKIIEIYKNGETYEIQGSGGGSVAFSGYAGFSSEGNIADITTTGMTEFTDTESITLTNPTEGNYLWVFSTTHLATVCDGVNLPLYYGGTKDGYHVYRSDEMQAASVFLTFGTGNANETAETMPTIFAVTYSLENLTAANAPSEILNTDTATITLTPNTGYELPDSVTVTNATASYDGTSGSLAISGATEDVTVTAAGELIYFSVTNNLTEVTNSNDATTIGYGSAYTATLTPTTDYEIIVLSVSMGGLAVEVTDNTINIPSVTGNIVVTSEAAHIGHVTVAVTSSGTAVSGAAVQLTIDGSTFTGTTDSDGEVELTVPVGTGTLEVTQDGYVDYSASITVTSGTQTISAAISPLPRYTITGTANVDGVTIVLTGGETHTAVTASGAFTISNVLADTFAISCQGYSVSPSSIMVSGDTTLNLTLAELTMLLGTVTNETERTVSGATVQLSANGTELSTTTDSSGAYSFNDIPSGEATIFVTSSGHDAATKTVTLTSGNNTVNVEMRVALPSGYTRYDKGVFDGNGSALANIYPSSTMRFVAKARANDTGSESAMPNVFGNYDNTYITSLAFRKTGLLGIMGTDSTANRLNYTFSEETTDAHVLELSSDGLVMDGVTVNTFESPETYTSTYKFGIGTRRNKSGSAWGLFVGDIYWVKVYESGTLTHMYVPCTNAASPPAPRFYDIVAKVEPSKTGTWTVANDE